MFLGFLLKFLGGGVIQSLITARQNELASANETRRIVLQQELAILNAEVERRKTAAQLQQAEQQWRLLRAGKGLLMLSVGLYWAARFTARLLGLDDFNVMIKPLDGNEFQVSSMVLGYWFVTDGLGKMLGR